MAVKDLEKALLDASKSQDIAQIEAASDALKEGRRAEAKVLRAKADAEFEATTAARTELTTRFDKAVGEVVGKFKGEIVKLVGEEAFPHYSIDYKNGDAKVVGIMRLRVKATKTPGTGGGKRGKIQELFEAHATAEEKSALASDIAAARAKDGTCRVDGIEYKHRSKVQKRLIAAGTIQVAS